jgi:hypothetical protein
VLSYTNANVNGLLGWSGGEKWKRSLPLITKTESRTHKKTESEEDVK